MENGTLVTTTQLTKRYPMGEGGSLLALDDVNLTFQRGEFTGVVGPSGAPNTSHEDLPDAEVLRAATARIRAGESVAVATRPFLGDLWPGE